MDKCTIFRVFLHKILKEYKYSWLFRVFFLIIVPIALICTYLKISYSYTVHNEKFDGFDKVRRRNSSKRRAKSSLILIPIFPPYQAELSFPGGTEDKLFFYPDNTVTDNIIEELRVPLGIVYASRLTALCSTSSIFVLITLIFCFQGSRASVHWRHLTRRSLGTATGTCTQSCSTRQVARVCSTR